MILVPFFWDCHGTKDWINFGVFLCSGGRQYWSVDDGTSSEEVTSMLSENGFPVINISVKDNMIFAEIDRQQINMDDFYLWSEIDPKTSEQDVWRVYKIPAALWSCPIFKQHFWKTSNLLDSIAGSIDQG
jgi:hypothetical protein